MFSAILNNLPALLIAVPLFAAPLAALMPASRGWRWCAWSISFMASAFVFIGSFQLFVSVDDNGAHGYIMGNWPPPIGIQFMATQLNTFVLLVLSGINFIILPFAMVSVEKEIPRPRIPLFYAAYLLALSGLFGMVISNDVFNIFVFLEISSLALYALISVGRGKAALTSTFNYLVTGTTGATFFLFGIAFLYSETGTLNITDLAIILSGNSGSKLVIAAFMLMLTGLMIKAAVFPFSGWLPKVYTHAPSFVTAFMATTATKIALFLILRIMYEIFPPIPLVQVILTLLACVGIVYGSAMALRQDNAKTLLAYSSIANISYILLGIASGSVIGIAAALFHYLAHSAAKAGMFTALGMASLQTGSTKLSDLQGFGHKYPIIGGSLLLLGASLVGIPLTAGFITKWYLLNSAMELEYGFMQAIVMLSIIAGSLLAACYIWKLAETLYFGSNKRDDKVEFSGSPLTSLCLVTIIIGLYATPLVNYLFKTATLILSRGVNV